MNLDYNTFSSCRKCPQSMYKINRQLLTLVPFSHLTIQRTIIICTPRVVFVPNCSKEKGQATFLGGCPQMHKRQKFNLSTQPMGKEGNKLARLARCTPLPSIPDQSLRVCDFDTRWPAQSIQMAHWVYLRFLVPVGQQNPHGKTPKLCLDIVAEGTLNSGAQAQVRAPARAHACKKRLGYCLTVPMLNIY